jgi:hypothetical protein
VCLLHRVIAGSPPTKAEQPRFPHRRLPPRGAHRRSLPSEHLQPRHHFKKYCLSSYFDHVYTFTIDDLRSEPKLPSSFPGRREPPINSPHQPSSGPVDPGNSFARAPCYSLTSFPSTSTPPPVQRRCFPADRAPPPWRHRYGEPPSILPPPTSSPSSRLLPQHHLLR